MKDIKSYIYETQQLKSFADIIIDCNGELLLLRRANYIKRYGGKWCIPGGHVDSKESSEESALRELLEETSIIIDKPVFLTTHKYSTGETSDIYYKQISEKPEVKITREHAQYKWVPIVELNKYTGKWAGETHEIIQKYIEITQ